MNDFPKTRYSLITRVGDLSDRVSWAEFLRIYEPVVYRMARRRGLHRRSGNYPTSLYIGFPIDRPLGDGARQTAISGLVDNDHA